MWVSNGRSPNLHVMGIVARDCKADSQLRTKAGEVRQGDHCSRVITFATISYIKFLTQLVILILWCEKSSYQSHVIGGPAAAVQQSRIRAKVNQEAKAPIVN